LTEAAGRGIALDLTLPGRRVWRGALHPVTQVIDEICEIFRELGFTRIIGPEVETEEYNFTKLNIPLDHPAADAHDTFYLSPGILLRTHTSPMQARTMERYPPPIRVVVPGLAYRRDPFDPSHSPAFFCQGHRGTLPAVLLSVRRARRRGRHSVPDLQRERLQYL
jgi:phenylalanyl-tRNA synthetase alpha chain